MFEDDSQKKVVQSSRSYLYVHMCAHVSGNKGAQKNNCQLQGHHRKQNMMLDVDDAMMLTNIVVHRDCPKSAASTACQKEMRDGVQNLWREVMLYHMMRNTLTSCHHGAVVLSINNTGSALMKCQTTVTDVYLERPHAVKFARVLGRLRHKNR